MGPGHQKCGRRRRCPRPEIKTPVALTVNKTKCLLEVARDDCLYALYVLAITTGMRQGELLGIMWEDLDLDQGTLDVSRASQSLQHKGTELRFLGDFFDVLEGHFRPKMPLLRPRKGWNPARQNCGFRI